MALWDDDRGQSVQVGVVLLFAVLVILLAMYQSTVVPNQDKAAEFEHSLAVQQDMLEARSGIIDAFQSGETAPSTIKLGTTYPNHVFAVDPAPVAGSIRTSGGGSVSVTDANGNPVAACPVSNETKFLNYSAGYNFLRPKPTLVYENSVLYADYGDNQVVLSGQKLVSGDTINLIQVQGNYSANGIAATDVDPRAGNWTQSTVANPNISVPTNLGVTHWRNLLSPYVENDTRDISVSNGELNVNISKPQQKTYTVRCGKVGVNENPPGGARPPENGTNNQGNLNPPQLRLADYQWDKGNVTLTFNNTGGRTAFTKGRINFYYSTSNDHSGSGNNGNSGSKPTQAEVYSPGTPDPRATFGIGGNLHTIQPKIALDGGGATTNVSLKFDKQPNGQDWFIVTFYTESGQQNFYIVKG